MTNEGKKAAARKRARRASRQAAREQAKAQAQRESERHPLSDEYPVARAQQKSDPEPRGFGEHVPDVGRAWTRATEGHALLRDVLQGFKEEVAELRALIRDELLPGLEKALSDAGDQTEANTAMLDRVETAIMELPGWGRKQVLTHVPGIGVTKVLCVGEEKGIGACKCGCCTALLAEEQAADGKEE